MADLLVNLLEKEFPGHQFDVRTEYDAQDMIPFKRVFVNNKRTRIGYNPDQIEEAAGFYNMTPAQLLHETVQKVGVFIRTGE